MTDPTGLNRRDFLRGATVSSLGLAFAVHELSAEGQATKPAAGESDDKPTGPPVGCAVIGLGPQGRELLTALAKLSNGPVVAICDSYQSPAFVKRAQAIAPKATAASDYRKVLGMKEVEAVFVATPTHLHKQIVLDALAAGKHVYCEAPIAHDMADARAIAKAAQAAKPVFQAGLHYRANKMHNHVLGFIKSDTLGHVCGGRGQWHKRTSWKSSAPTPAREKELNWRLDPAVSLGLVGEVGIHAFDVADWYLNALPVSVIGFGGIYHWKDGRQVPDTVQCVLEYPGGLRYMYDATIVNSLDGAYEVFNGAKSAIMVRDQRGWMFEESDAPMLGWEVYAQKDTRGVGNDNWGTGIALIADASKQIAQGKEPGKIGQDVTKTALYHSANAFLKSIRGGKKPNAGPVEAYQSVVVAAKVAEAVRTGQKVAFQKEWFTL